MGNKDVRILIVDDEELMADSLRQHFEDDGYSVDTALLALKPLSALTRAGITWRYASCSYRTWMVWW